MNRGEAMLGKVTIMDRSYDDNKIFLKIDELQKDYVIRLNAKRKLFFHNKWVSVTRLRNERKGKIKSQLYYKGKNHIKVQITASKKTYTCPCL